MLNQAPPLNPVAIAQAVQANNPHAIPQTAAPATPQGTSPNTQIPVNVAPTPAPPAASSTPENLLAGYEKPSDNNNKPNSDGNSPDGNKPAPNPYDALVAPQMSDYADVAAKAVGGISIDAELQTAALSGDVAAFGALLNQFGGQLLQNALALSSAQSLHYTKTGMEAAKDSVNSHVVTTQAQTAAEAAAVAEIPELSNGLNQQYLQTTIADLRAKYPTAPAELIGKQAANQLRGLVPQPANPADQPIDWSKEF